MKIAAKIRRLKLTSRAKRVQRLREDAEITQWLNEIRGA